LGAIPDDRSKPSLPFSRIFRQISGGPSAVIPQRSFSNAVDNLATLSNWQYLGNNRFGTCVAAAWANQRRLVSSRLGNKEVYPTEAQAIALYKAQNPGFDPSAPKGADGKYPFDNGMSIQKLLDHMSANGGTDDDRVKPVFYARIGPKDLQAVRQAIEIFGSVWISFDVLKKSNDGGKTWERTGYKRDEKYFYDVPGAPVLAGHSVIVGGHVPGKMKCANWADLWHIDESYWTGGRVNDVWAVVWPEHIGTRNFMLGVDLEQLYIEYKRLTKSNPPFPKAPFSDVFFLKTANTQSAKVEVHVSRAKHIYSPPPDSTEPRIFSSPFALNSITATDILDVDDGDLYVIRTANTTSGRVEFQRATAASTYKTLDPQQPVATAFTTADAANGKFIVDNGDFYFIKTKNTTHGNVEITRAPRADNYQLPAGTVPVKTTLTVSEAANGTFAVLGGNVFFIKIKNTGSNTAEVFLFRAVDKYAVQPTFYSTSFNIAEGPKGTWDVGPNKDLYFIKQTGVNQFQKTEVHILPAETSGLEKKYTGKISTYTSWVDEDDGRNGVWRAR